MKCLVFWISSVVYVSALAAVNHPIKSANSRITEGKLAIRGQFPYQVSFQWGLLQLYQHICGATILSPTYILTAGHCITETPSFGYFRVVAGVTNLWDVLSSEKQISFVDKTYVHPKYLGGVSPNDIAVARLGTALRFTQTVKPIALPENDAIPVGNATLSGWGDTSKIILPLYTLDLQYAKMPLLTNDECITELIDLEDGDETPPVNETNICTGQLVNHRQTGCSGDSGGPLEQNGKIIGVVSWGIWPCGQVEAPTVFVRVGAFLDFIKKHVTDLPAADEEKQQKATFTGKN